MPPSDPANLQGAGRQLSSPESSLSQHQYPVLRAHPAASFRTAGSAGADRIGRDASAPAYPPALLARGRGDGELILRHRPPCIRVCRASLRRVSADRRLRSACPTAPPAVKSSRPSRPPLPAPRGSPAHRIPAGYQPELLDGTGKQAMRPRAKFCRRTMLASDRKAGRARLSASRCSRAIVRLLLAFARTPSSAAAACS
eukprot:scaffold389_cov382-Prasinococcus_capsulatus_cf.AAC.9